MDVFNLNGALIKHLVSNGGSSPLDAPWGLAVAPPKFGPFAGDLLVGNLGNGWINAFNKTTGNSTGPSTGPRIPDHDRRSLGPLIAAIPRSVEHLPSCSPPGRRVRKRLTWGRPPRLIPSKLQGGCRKAPERGKMDRGPDPVAEGLGYPSAFRAGLSLRAAARRSPGAARFGAGPSSSAPAPCCSSYAPAGPPSPWSATDRLAIFRPSDDAPGLGHEHRNLRDIPRHDVHIADDVGHHEEHHATHHSGRPVHERGHDLVSWRAVRDAHGCGL